MMDRQPPAGNSPEEGAWIEAVALFDYACEGDYASAMTLFETCARPATVTYFMLRLVSMFNKLSEDVHHEEFVGTAYYVNPPPVPAETAKADARRLQED